MKDVTFKVGSQNADGTITLVPASTAMVPAPAAPMLGGYRAEFMGMNIYFDSEEDYRRADQMYRRSMMGGGGSMMGGGGNGPGGRGAGFLRTGAETAEAVSAFYQGRNLRAKRQDYIDAIDNAGVQLDKLNQMQSKYPDLIPVLMDVIQSERDKNEAALELLDDSITAVDIQSGAGVAKVVDDVWSGGRGFGNGFGGNGGGAVAAGVVGLGLGWLAFSRDRNETRFPRRR